MQSRTDVLSVPKPFFQVRYQNKIVKLEKIHTIIGNNHYIRFLSTILPVTFCISLKHWHSIESVSKDIFFKFFFSILHKCHVSLMLANDFLRIHKCINGYP